MKRTLFILIMLLVMASSLTAGTLAMYTTTIDNMAKGSVAAKEFVFTGEGTDSFAQNVKIAPKGTVSWQFYVKNYSGIIVTETDMYYKLTFNVQASEGKTAIAPITVTVKDQNGSSVGSATGVGTFDVLGEFPLSETGQEDMYTVEVYWPSDDNVDIDYAGGGYGTSIIISAIASQVPLSGSQPVPTPTPTATPTPQASDISVLYQTTEPWSNGGGGYAFNYNITITNNSDQPIEDWFIDFALSGDTLTSVWGNAKMTTGLPAGTYKIVNPAYNNSATDDILPGQSVSFGGQGSGSGVSAPHSVNVGGSNAQPAGVTLDCQFGSLS